MDLLTVVTHEYGHILGFGPTDTGVMETTLGPGVQRVPEALTHSATVGVPGTSAAGSFSVGVPATTSTAVSRTAEPARVPQTSPSHTETVEASFVTTGRDVSLSTAAGAIQNGTGILRNLAGVLVNPGQQSPLVLSAVVADSVLGPAGVGRDFSSILVPGLWPPLPRLESGSDMVLPSDEAQDADPAEWLLPRAKPSDTPLDLGADAQTGLGLRQQAFDACFADGSWQAEPVAAEESASAPDAVAASAALALVLGSYWSAPRTETERRMRQRFPR